MCPTWSYVGYALSHYRIKILQPESMIIDWEGKTSPTDLSPLFLEFTNSATPSFFFLEVDEYQSEFMVSGGL